jgi:hypothetical protein
LSMRATSGMTVFMLYPDPRKLNKIGEKSTNAAAWAAGRLRSGILGCFTGARKSVLAARRQRGCGLCRRANVRIDAMVNSLADR